MPQNKPIEESGKMFFIVGIDQFMREKVVEYPDDKKNYCETHHLAMYPSREDAQAVIDVKHQIEVQRHRPVPSSTYQGRAYRQDAGRFYRD